MKGEYSIMKALINPDSYHGNNKRTNFFEGWYFKLVDSSKKNVYAFIPGIFLGKNASQSHSFIQTLNASTASYNYLKYSTESFKSFKNVFQISVGENSFSLNGLSLNIKDINLNISGKIAFQNVLKWPDSLINPGSMGYYNYLKFMQCYSQVCAIDMDLSGALNINGQCIDFNGGKGYIEKNWGKSFPHSWIWVQGNNFNNTRASLSCSIGHIPFLFGSFRGFLIGFRVNDSFIKFTTLNKSILNISRKNSDVLIEVESNQYKLKIETYTNKRDFILCNGPRDDKMIPLVEENLLANIAVELIDKKINHPVFIDNSSCAGIEYGGDQMWIINK